MESKLNGIRTSRESMMTTQYDSAYLYVAQPRRGRIQDVQRNFSTLRFRVWEVDRATAVQPLLSPQCTCSRVAPRIATLIPDPSTHDRTSTRRYISINSTIHYDVKPHRSAQASNHLAVQNAK